MTDLLLEVRGLKTWLGKSQPLRAVDGIDFKIKRGETFALLGESGCGKSMTALSILALHPKPASHIEAGQVFLAGQDLLSLSEAEMQHVRGRRIAMIFQEPQSSLNPVLSVGEQISECLVLHFGFNKKQCYDRVISLLESVGIPDPKQRIKEYPHQLSGGMKQRVMIAMALAGEPELLIADEPTTALDVTIQAQILELLKDIQRKTGMAILLISHDLAVIAQMADHVAVMYAGQIVETASREQFFNQHQHPYTKKLFAALPSEQKRNQRLTVIKGSVPILTQQFDGCRFVERCDHAWELCHSTAPEWNKEDEHAVRCHLFDSKITDEQRKSEQDNQSSPLSDVIPSKRVVLDIKDLKVHFPIRSGFLQRITANVKAVDGVSLSIHQAETVALVGESGCGKTTVGKGILQLVDVSAGEVNYRGHNLCELSERQLKPYRSSLQIIFQDPFSSMNPRMTVAQIIEEGMIGKRYKELQLKEERVDELLERVGLRAEIKHRYPHEFSGGQRQRICIARALASDPEVIICDEPTSALDVSVQAQILNLLREIQHEFGLSYLFITHNISVVNYLAHRVAVMYLGRIVEQGSRDEVLDSPKHPYTRALLAAVPELDPNSQQELIRLEGELPSPANPPQGCHFHQRCPEVMPHCLEAYPPITHLSDTHEVRCFLYKENK
ncbi:MAG: ABC transporter ATP-binding protein [Piscirickettsiaceae bacterium]|nr:ABC transporter ATP-binding protein [Piscirickettsiaceae bacterium]